METRFIPAENATREFYERSAREILPKLAKITGPERETVIAGILSIFDGSRGVLRLREGEVGFDVTTIKTYDAAIVESLLPDLAWKVIKDGRVITNLLEEELDRQRKAKAIDPAYAKMVLHSACTTETVSNFVARPATPEYLSRWDEEHSPMLPPKSAALQRFKGYCI